MATTRYGQIVGNTCIDVVSFDPARTSVDQMEGSLGAKLIPISDYLDGAWGVGATWDGLQITQDGVAGLDSPQVTGMVTDLQAQADYLTELVATQASAGKIIAGTTTTSSNGQATVTWSSPFVSAPIVSITAKNVAGNNYLISGELLAVSATGATVRAWRSQTSAAGSASVPVATLTSAVLHIMAFGVLA